MSSPLAVATVTAVLKDLLDNALVDSSASEVAGGAVTVSTLSPARVTVGAQEKAQLNLFLYHVAPNLGWRNAGLPGRDGSGARVGTPPLALDLHYLLSAYGASDFEPEILLGYAMHVLHETPILTRDAIRKSLETEPLDATVLPPALGALVASDLADQVELIKITPQSLGGEEMSRLWTALQSPYRPSVAYQVSVVIIEARRPVRAPLPVISRGPADRGVAVEASATPPGPRVATLSAAVPANRQPAARLGERLTLEGHHLDGDGVTVLLAHPLLSAPITRAPEAGATATRLEVELEVDPVDDGARWPIGVYTARVVVSRAGQPDERSNAVPFLVAPAIGPFTVNVTHDAEGKPTLTLGVSCSPQVRPGQQVSVVLGQREVLAPDRAAPAANLSFVVPGVGPGTYPVRLRVDGVESVLINRTVSPPVFDATQRVTVP